MYLIKEIQVLYPRCKHVLLSLRIQTWLLETIGRRCFIYFYSSYIERYQENEKEHYYTLTSIQLFCIGPNPYIYSFSHYNVKQFWVLLHCEMSSIFNFAIDKLQSWKELTHFVWISSKKAHVHTYTRNAAGVHFSRDAGCRVREILLRSSL